ncbi:MAG TPA: hypothetical protein VK203_03995 [Nostocaceae cyanobacterium]|nr:hypothetical protein [Nostocaceae cyanobacterium]
MNLATVVDLIAHQSWILLIDTKNLLQKSTQKRGKANAGNPSDGTFRQLCVFAA